MADVLGFPVRPLTPQCSDLQHRVPPLARGENTFERLDVESVLAADCAVCTREDDE